MELDHRCKQKDCMNPDHLEPVSHTENVRRGSHTVLDWEKVREIRRLAAMGSKQVKIAERFGITRTQVWHIVHNRQWRES
jgi:hypothetical protein